MLNVFLTVLYLFIGFWFGEKALDLLNEGDLKSENKQIVKGVSFILYLFGWPVMVFFGLLLTVWEKIQQ